MNKFIEIASKLFYTHAYTIYGTQEPKPEPVPLTKYIIASAAVVVAAVVGIIIIIKPKKKKLKKKMQEEPVELYGVPKSELEKIEEDSQEDSNGEE